MSTEPKHDSVAEAARKALEQRGMSVRKFADRIGMKPDTVNDFLHQRRETRRSTRFSICRELGLNPDTGHAA
ncbi:helix-turn-helix domain-containing protein [Deinococcus daejeonensis]|uniref:HTH cro/C1-type domain-containing protein n=1 Tax=Deinococcus daejeonensis TaxID=1007098 RepID=A0ABQ2IZ33_9DEIO|nr:helix-turn-helix transcriptional regulator [Deinococcus daejeonensis]GGN32427.1 hypothetical protein GCM10010842_09090 [Deinococcus daejeonensis]